MHRGWAPGGLHSQTMLHLPGDTVDHRISSSATDGTTHVLHSSNQVSTAHGAHIAAFPSLHHVTIHAHDGSVSTWMCQHVNFPIQLWLSLRTSKAAARPCALASSKLSNRFCWLLCGLGGSWLHAGRPGWPFTHKITADKVEQTLLHDDEVRHVDSTIQHRRRAWCDMC